MPERASRAVFIVELLVFALPAILLLGTYAVILGGWSLFAAIVAAVMPLMEANAGLATFDLLTMFIVSLLIAVSGLIALWNFMTVAFGFARYGTRALCKSTRVFNRGLAFAVLPLCIAVPFGLALGHAGYPEDIVPAAYLSGLPLLVPVVHLWLEMRCRSKAT